MNKEIQKKLNGFSTQRKARKKWIWICGTLCVLVAAGISYVLINPASTQKAQTFCGYEEHIEHTDECYEKILVCNLSEEGHEHTDECWQEVETLTCGLEETEGHHHGEECYVSERTLELECALEEHVHTDECREVRETCICGLEESEEHQHGEECFLKEEVIICGKEEHTHSLECYKEEQVLICELPECEPHQHDESCYTAETVCVCGFEESGKHKHTDECYQPDYSKLICTLPIHEHTLQCFSNPAADLESSDVWERTFESVQLSGKWDEDVLAVALTQLGYAESTANYQVQEDGVSVKGYTRYGAWYGDPYGDWCAMFCSFCMHYARVDEKLFPVESNCAKWIELLEKEECGLFRQASDYMPKPGDLVFFDWNGDKTADHVGFVAELKANEEGNITAIKTLEGNSADRVQHISYQLSSPEIFGYAELPENPVPAAAAEPENDAEQAATEAEAEPVELLHQTFEGEDFTVEASYGPDAGIPENAVLKARKILPDSEEYQQYYQQAVQAMIDNGTATSEENANISYMQFYDIGFYVDDVEIEPTGPVNIVIHSDETPELQAGENGSAIHFGENGTEILDADVAGAEESGNSFSFVQDSFSVTGVVISGTDYTPTTSIKEGDKVIVASYQGNSNNTWYLTDTIKPESYIKYGNQNYTTDMLGLTTNKDQATVWTVEKVNNYFTLKNGSGKYIQPWCYDNGNGQLGATLTTDKWNAVNATYKDGGYWELYYNSAYLNEYSGHGYGKAAGWFQGADNDSGSRWQILKNTSGGSDPTPTPTPTPTPDPSGAPAKGSVSGVQTDRLTVGEWYIIYTANGDALYSHINGNTSEQTMGSVDLSQVSTVGGTVTYTGNEDVVWQWTGDGFRDRLGRYIRMGHSESQYDTQANLWVSDNAESQYNAYYNANYRIIYNEQNAWGVNYNKLNIHTWDSNVTAVSETFLGPIQQSGAGSIYLAQVTGNPSITTGHSNHPRTSTTGTVDNTNLIFFNVDATDGATVKGLAGVTYTISDANGNDIGTYMTTSDYGVRIGKLTPGATYTIRQTGVPEGYIVVSQDKTFTVGSDGTAVIGTFYDYKTPGNYDAVKTASVVDYINRTYQIDLHTSQDLYEYTVEAFDFTWVLDQSNSMLFPSKLIDTGKTIYLDRSGSGNGNRLNNLGLDKNRTYYVISNPTVSSTVWAIFWDGSGWAYQDASYYAKTQNFEDGYTINVADGDKYTAFARSDTGFVGVDSNNKQISGGSIDRELGDTLYTNTYTLYTGSQYNRLHDLQESLNMLASTLAAMNPNITVRLETFDWRVEICQSFKLGSDGSGVKSLINAVNNIKTDGGTRQDLALRHLNGNEGAVSADHYNNYNHMNNGRDQYVLLVTDGAPAGSGSQEALTNVLNEANTLKSNSKVTLITLGLSMKDVQGGSQMLREAASNSSWSYSAEGAEETADALTKLLFKVAAPEKYYDFEADIRDEISDSFYPINPVTKAALTDGTIINLDGNVLGSKPSDGKYGTVKYDSSKGTWYVVWNDQALKKGTKKYPNGVPWDGRVYVKAKEDFIGGNTIDTNKQATVTIRVPDTDTIKVRSELPSPTVNVRLLDFNSVNSQETVFLGDEISVKEKIESYISQLYFTKLVDNGDDVHNKSASSSTDGLETGTFTLPYAWGKNLSDSDWAVLFSGNTLSIPYTYDDLSSHGPVGYFTLQLTKTGDTADYEDHDASATGSNVETYTLNITFNPYKIGTGDSERPTNVHNGTAGPGTKLKRSDAKSHSNVHKVNVVDGKITIVKTITDRLKSTEDQVFTFTLTDTEDGNAEPQQITVKVNAGETTGTFDVTKVPRGTYKLIEVTANQDYHVTELAADSSGTNCEQIDSETENEVIFKIGYDADGKDLITIYQVPSSGYLQVYSGLAEGYTGTDGISFETVKVKNDKLVYSAVIPVEKVWSQVSNQVIKDKKVYVALYKDGNPVLDEEGRVWALVLNKDNNWKGEFTVELENATDDVSLMGYTVRELDNAGTENGTERVNTAVLMNAEEGKPNVVYYEDALQSGEISLDSALYIVSVSMDKDANDVYSATVTNSASYELPKSGGAGITLYILGGLLLMAGAAYGCALRRRRERRSM